jgi:hypothetical protein
MKEAIGYVRVSSEEQAGSGLGLQAWRQLIVSSREMRGLRLSKVCEGACVSGVGCCRTAHPTPGP